MTTTLLSAANHAAALLESLDLAALPELAALHVAENRLDGWTIGTMGQLATTWLDESQRIDAIRVWAAALGGELRMTEGEDHLAAVLRLSDGSLFEVWAFLQPVVAPAPIAVNEAKLAADAAKEGN